MAVVANGPVNPDTCGCSRLPCASPDVAGAADPTPSKNNGIGLSTKGLGSAALGTATQNRGSGSNPSTQPHNNLTTQLEELMGEVRRLHDVVRGYKLHEPQPRAAAGRLPDWLAHTTDDEGLEGAAPDSVDPFGAGDHHGGDSIQPWTGTEPTDHTDQVIDDVVDSLGEAIVERPEPAPRKLEDLIVGIAPEDASKTWQFNPYGRDSATWLAAAQRRHQHRRRSNAALGVACVDLSGPHEPTPTVGHRMGQLPGHYFLVLTVQADHLTGHSNGSTQTDHVPEQDEVDEPSPLCAPVGAAEGGGASVPGEGAPTPENKTENYH